MARKTDFGRYILSAGEIGAFTVCPEAWRLSAVKKVKTLRSESADEGLGLHSEWAKGLDQAVLLKDAAFGVVCIIAIALTFFALLATNKSSGLRTITSVSAWLASVDSQAVMFALILVSGLMVLSGIVRTADSKSKSVGINPLSTTVSIDGGKAVAVRHYLSEMQGLAGKPDALLSENSFIIPVERKPLAKKLRDRYVAQLLVYMRLIEEFEGRKPPYGYLILGPSCRTIKIENSEARQAWLQSLIDSMQKSLHGSETTASPHPRKCAKCDVRLHCRHFTGADKKIAGNA